MIRATNLINRNGCGTWNALHSLTLGIFGEADVVEFVRTEDAAALAFLVKKDYLYSDPSNTSAARQRKEIMTAYSFVPRQFVLKKCCNAASKKQTCITVETRRRETVALDQQLRDEVKRLSEYMHHMHREGLTPKPDMKLSVCKKCSMFDICLPNMRKKTSVKSYWDQLLGELTPNENGVID
jgi:CRISPR-associated exonuclease Cas4